MIAELTDGDAFLNSYLANKKYAYITSVTHEYADIAYNWFLSLKNIQSEHLAVVIALDKKCYEQMQKYNVPCVYINADISSNESYNEWLETEKRTKVIGPLYIAKKYNIDPIHSEVDIIFLRDPITKLKSEIESGYDLTAISDKRFDQFTPSRRQGIVSHVDRASGKVLLLGESYQKKHGEANFGFCYNSFSTSPKLFDFWESVLPDSDFLKKFNYEGIEGSMQTVLIHKIKENSNVKIKVLSAFEFANGSIWDNPYLKEKVKEEGYLIHYNFSPDEMSERKEAKILLMRKNNHWYV